ncbi:MAG: EamA family transporter [Anaerolineaceae bacterium]|nr:EamA family transporter [Anaerolineaceae bacterium]
MAKATQQSKKSTLSSTGLFHLLVVYIVWGSTYLAIRVGVRPGSGFTPFVFGAMRVLTASAILLALAALTHQRLRLTRKELMNLAGSGLLLWLGGNGLVVFAEQRVNSGLTALIIAGVPIWVAIYNTIADRKTPSLLVIGALLTGMAGILLLSMPLLLSGVKADFFSVIIMLAASISWAGGAWLQSRTPTKLAPSVSSGYQMFFGGIGFALTALILREPLPTPIPQAWLAWGYLVIFGSLLAFTSFIRALRMLPTNIVMTYSFVNPIIAVLLGWIILGEQITYWTVAGAVLILLGVAGAFRAHSREQAALPQPAQPEGSETASI